MQQDNKNKKMPLGDEGYVLAPPRTPTVERPTMIKLRSVVKQTGLSRTTIYRQIKAGQFPEQVQLGVRAVGWDEKEVNSFLRKKMEARLHAMERVLDACQ